MFKITRIISVFVLAGLSASGQEISVTGTFREDTIQIGEELRYSLSATYPRTYNLIFPDSAYDFTPFEYHDRKYFRTSSDSVISFDSVVYYLSTFEIDTIQYLQLPVFINQGGDSTEIYSRRDSIAILYIIKEMPDSVALKENNEFVSIPNRFNYPVFLAALGFVALIILIGLLFFGNRIKRWIHIFFMKQNHKKFVRKFYLSLAGVRDNRPGVEAEDVLAVWKKYMEKLEKEPYTKLTTKELIRLHADQRLKDNLRSIDRYIYGEIRDKPLHENFEKLLEYTKERYEVRLSELKNG